MLWRTAILAGMLVSVVKAAESNMSRQTGAWNETDLIDEALEDVSNKTDKDERARTFIFGKNGVVKHENVIDNEKDESHGKMEFLIELSDRRHEFLQEAASRSGNSSAGLDPNDDLEKLYQELKEELTEEYNGTIYDPEVEFENSESTNESSSSLERGKRWNWGGPAAEWPKAIVPYTYEAGDWQGIRAAMDQYEDLTCMRFIPRLETTNEELGLGHPGYLRFISKNGCWAYIGNHKWSGGQWISCCGGWRCVHELGHSFGQMHEQNNYLRDGWMRVNDANIQNGYEGVYVRGADGTHFSLGYDITSYMHYRPGDFSIGNDKPVMTSLFPELTFGGQDFYMFREINAVQKCEKTEACADFKIKCENDGYVTVLMGKCSCRCPTGLDPETGCTTPLKQISPEIKMPRGQYALLKPKTGCPEVSGSTFKEGKLVHYGEERNYYDKDTLAGEISKRRAEHQFCVHDDETFDGMVEGFFEPKSTWPVGKYCILRKGGKCPEGLKPGHVKYGDLPPTDKTSNSQEGELPDGVFDEDTRLEFCCQNHGEATVPIVMPTSKPFILFPFNFEPCQKIMGMQSRRERFGFDSMDNKGFELEGLMGYLDFDAFLSLDYCYYTASDMDCGDVITLSADNPEAVIEIGGTGGTDMECTWLVKGDHEEGSIVLNFDEFDVWCGDKLEIRHARIGQNGLFYCGTDDKRSVKSILDKMLIRLKTYGQTSSKAKATVRWIPNSDMCYSVEERGIHYSGHVNYTSLLEPCLSWTEVSTCPHNPWTVGDELDNLEGNYCRNPDNSLGPWCYTDLNDCKRSYCDVCRKENLFDRSADCAQQKGEGYCTEDPAAAIHNCGKTCSDQLANTGPVEKYSEVQCDPPSTPVDGVLVGDEKSKYAFGEEATFKCRHGGRSLTKTCLSNGDWTSLGFVCIECPLGAVIRDDSCYLFVDRALNYVEAKAECNNIGGEAAMPNYAEEGKFISNIAKNKTVWIGVTDSETEGTWILEDGNPAEWKNFVGTEPNNWNNEEHCVSMDKDGAWADRVCDYDASWAKMPVVCEVPKVSTLECADYLEEDRCVDLLTHKTTMCKDYLSFAEEYCAKTCGVCGPKDTTCLVESPTEHVEILSNVTSLIVGEDIEFSCKTDMVKIKGNEHRACLPSGKLSGEELVCEDPSKILVFKTVGMKPLSKGQRDLPGGTAYSGENGQLKINVEGEVYAWEFYSNSPSVHAFQVCRVVEPQSQYKLVGQTIVTTGNDLEERYELPEDQRIPVQPGDVIGIWKQDSGGVGFSQCSPVDNPTFPGRTWTRKYASASDFKVGHVESFDFAWSCLTLSYRAVISVKK